MSERNEQLVQRITSAQPKLYAYILSLLPDSEAARDVLQETNLVLWRKAEEFRPELNFLTWACRVAQFQVLAYCRDRRRAQVRFDARLIEEIAVEWQAAPLDAEMDARQQALEECLRKLRANDRELIEKRYAEGGSVKTLAAGTETTANAISRKLYRIRGALMECIDRSLAGGHAT